MGCDGRHAITTEAAHLEYVNLGAPIDVLWLRMSRREDDPDNALGNVNYGGLLVLINRGDYFQCGYVIKKDSFEKQIKPAGLPAFFFAAFFFFGTCDRPGVKSTMRL